MEESKISSLLKDQKFVISGVFKNVSREQLKEKIELFGGSVMTSISPKTSYVLAGEGLGPSKKIKAEKFNIPVIDELTFFNMIDLK